MNRIEDRIALNKDFKEGKEPSHEAYQKREKEKKRDNQTSYVLAEIFDMVKSKELRERFNEVRKECIKWGITDYVIELKDALYRATLNGEVTREDADEISREITEKFSEINKSYGSNFYEMALYCDPQIEQNEKEEPWDTKIIFQRHSEYKKEPREECYWRLGISGEKKQDLINFLVEKNIISEEYRKEIEKSKFIEDELIKIVDQGKLLNSPEEKEFLDFLVGIEFAENPEEARETFKEYINNNRNFNELKEGKKGKNGKKEKEKIDSGLLTEKGKELTKEETKKRLEEITVEGKPIDVVLLYSPTEWMDWCDEQGFAKGFGSRGKETTKVILDTISSEMKENTELGKKIKENVQITGIGPNEKLRELDIFYIFDAPNPKAYIKALHEKFGKEDWWEPYYNIVEELEDLRKEMKAEGPKDLSKRFELVIKTTELYNNKIKKEGQERNLVIWMVSHMELIRSFVQYKLEAKEDAIDYHPDFNESLDISISSEGKITTRFKGKEYEIDLDEIK